MSTWHWITFQGFFIQNYSPSLSCYQLPVSLPLGVELVEFLPSTLANQAVLSLGRSCVGNHIVEMSWVQHPRRANEDTSLTVHPGP